MNLRSQLRKDQSSRVVVTSASSTGSSEMAAALATSFAASGERVLIVNAHPQAKEANSWYALLTSQRSTTDRYIITLDDQIDLLPATALIDKAGNIDLLRLTGLLDHMRGYGVVLIDTPPLLASPEAVTLAAQANGLVLTVSPNVTKIQDVKAALVAAHTAQAHVLGFAMAQSVSIKPQPHSTLPQPHGNIELDLQS